MDQDERLHVERRWLQINMLGWSLAKKFSTRGRRFTYSRSTEHDKSVTELVINTIAVVYLMRRFLCGYKCQLGIVIKK